MKRGPYISVVFIGLLLACVSPVLAAPIEHSLSDTSEYNYRLDGESTDDWMPYGGIVVGDLNENGINDLLIGTPYNANNTGALYLIYDYANRDYGMSAKSIDLADSSNYDIKFTGSASGDYFTRYIKGAAIADFNTDGRNELLIGASYMHYNTRVDAGSLFIVYPDLLASFGTGVTLNMLDPANYTVRYVGSGDNFTLTCGALAVVADIDGNGKNDILIGEDEATRHGIPNNGSMYIVYDGIIDTYLETPGQLIDLATNTNYSVRYDAASDSDNGSGYGSALTNGLHTVADINGDGKLDLLITARQSSFNARATSGSLYLIDNALIPPQGSPTKTVDLTSGANFSIRIDGKIAFGQFAFFTLATGDVDEDGKADIVVGSAFMGENARVESGSEYMFYGDLLTDNWGPGTLIDLADEVTPMYSARIDGAAGGDRFGYSPLIADINYDGHLELLITGSFADPGGKSNAGSLYVIGNTLLSSFSGTGTQVDMFTTSNYTIRYDGAASGDTFGNGVFSLGDINNDGRLDILVGARAALHNGRSASGSLYIIANFPHTITLDPIPATVVLAPLTVTGSIVATDSVTEVSSAQYLIDSNAIDGTWRDCIANDGMFDSLDEDFTCDMTLPSGGAHTLYFRSIDSNGFITVREQYVEGQTTYVLSVLPQTGQFEVAPMLISVVFPLPSVFFACDKRSRKRRCKNGLENV